VRNGGRPLEWHEHRDGEGFKAVFALNHLAVGIIRAPSARLTAVAWENSLPILAYPHAERLEREGYSFSNIESFDTSIEVETWEGSTDLVHEITSSSACARELNACFFGWRFILVTPAKMMDRI
jgi:hypothetical protein